jgi:hypothetical protein
VVPNWKTAGFEEAMEAGVAARVPLYVYDFEEDCQWAIPVLLDDQAARQLAAKEYRDKPVEDLRSQAEWTARRWVKPAILRGALDLEPDVDNFHLRDAA